MGKETVLLRSKEMKSREDVATFLRTLAEKLDGEGTIRVQQGDDEVVLEVPSRVELQIKVEQEEKGSRTQLGMEVEFQWYVGDDAADTGVTLG